MQPNLFHTKGGGVGGGGVENDEDLIEGNVYLLVEAKPFSHDVGVRKRRRSDRGKCIPSFSHDGGWGGGGRGVENDVDLIV